MKRVAIITSSDTGYRGEREDLSGPAIREIVEKNGYEVLMKYCIKNDTFREIIETARHSTGVTNIHPDGITYYSTMFKNLSDPTVTGGKILGGKTGYTSEAGHCLVSFAEIEGREYIFVSAGASGADGNTIPHIQDAVTVYNRVGAAIEAKMNDNNK